VNHVPNGRRSPASVRRVLLRLVLVVLLPLLLLEAAIYACWYHGCLTDEEEANLKAARVVAATFEDFVNDVRRQELAIGAALTGLNPFNAEQAHSLLVVNEREYPSGCAWHWVNAEGKIIASNDQQAVNRNIADMECFKTVRDGELWAISNVLTDAVSGKPVFAVARRVVDKGGALRGVILVTVRVDNLGEYLLATHRDEEVLSRVYDAFGVLAYDSAKKAVVHRDCREEDPVLADVLKSRVEKTGTISMSPGGEKYIASRVPMATSGWVAGAHRPMRTAMAYVRRVLWILVGLNLLVAAGSIALAARTGGKLIGQVRRLQTHAQAIGRGDFGHVAEIRGVSELAELAVAFNQMGAAVSEAQEALEAANAALEERVRERTAELAATIHKLEQTERELRTASLYARGLIEASLDPLVTISLDGKITDVNKATEAATGASRSQLIGTDFSGYFTEPELARDGYQKVFSKGLVRDYPLTIQHVSGSTIDVLYNAVVYRNEAGEVQGVFAAARDVTERKRAELQVKQTSRALEAERRRFHEVLDMLPAYVILLTADYQVPFANRYFEERFGKSTGRRCYEYLFGRNEPCEICETYTVLKTQQPHRWEWTGPDERNYDISDFPFTDTDGAHLILEMGIDITERKQAEAELAKYQQHLEELVQQRTNQLEAANSQLQAVFDVANVGILLIDEHGAVKRVNDTLSRWVGRGLPASGPCQPGDIVGCVHAIAAPEGCGTTAHCRGCSIRNAFESVLRTGQPVHDVEAEAAISVGGKENRLWLEVSADPVVLDGKRNVILAMNNVTDRKRAENALKRSAAQLKRSNEELEQFAYVASHDLQEPLRVVTGYVQLIERKYKDRLDADADQFIRYIIDGVARMQQLITDLLNYSRVGSRSETFRPFNVQVAVDRALANLQPVIEDSKAVVTCDAMPTVRGDEAQLVQLFQNLIGNGIKFRGDLAPRIHISASRTGDGWEFAVHDNGIGIDKKYWEQIFVIFRRLHKRQEYPGTGIGLAICKRIVERHGGRIWLESEPGQGTAFHFTLS
jgi:PAS domain S-box-containing protein